MSNNFILDDLGKNFSAIKNLSLNEQLDILEQHVTNEEKACSSGILSESYLEKQFDNFLEQFDKFLKDEDSWKKEFAGKEELEGLLRLVGEKASFYKEICIHLVEQNKNSPSESRISSLIKRYAPLGMQVSSLAANANERYAEINKDAMRRTEEWLDRMAGKK